MTVLTLLLVNELGTYPAVSSRGDSKVSSMGSKGSGETRLGLHKIRLIQKQGQSEPNFEVSS